MTLNTRYTWDLSVHAPWNFTSAKFNSPEGLVIVCYSLATRKATQNGPKFKKFGGDLALHLHQTCNKVGNEFEVFASRKLYKTSP